MNKLNHVAFIMDGNGRWGKKKGRSRNYGHLKGVETVEKIVESSIKLKIPIITFYVFSTENWKRPKSEINFLFKLINKFFQDKINNVIKNGIKIKIMGEKKKLPISIRNNLDLVEKKTISNKKLVVNLALNYGSKNEIVEAVKKIKKKGQAVNEKVIAKNLFNNGQYDPEILIRTGGKRRLSNFMLWQLAYSEIYFLEKLWPDFNEKDLKKILNHFKNIKRNFGKI